MPDGSVPCILGKMEERLENLMKMNEDQMRELCQLSKRVRTLEDTMLSAKTGWATILWIGSLLTSLGVGGAWAYNHFYDAISKIMRAAGLQ